MTASGAIRLADTPAIGGTPDAVKRRVAEYYDRMQVFYSHCWSRSGVRYGFWEPGTRTQAEAIRNMDHQVAAALGLPRRGRVLDAGCGVGGSAAFLAEEHGLNVVGVTLSVGQLQRARRRAGRGRAGIPPTFLLADYLSTGFADGAFDGMVGIESVCYAHTKRAFLHEAFRLLRPGGRLVVMDGFLARAPAGRHLGAYRRFLGGFAIPSLATVEEFAAALAAAGFHDVRCTDKRDAIMPSARRIQVLSALALALAGIPLALGLLPRLWLEHARAGLCQRRLFRDRVLAYCVFVATRPAV